MLYGGCLFDNIDMASAKFARRHDIAWLVSFIEVSFALIGCRAPVKCHTAPLSVMRVA
jgi:hypothetical protein